VPKDFDIKYSKKINRVDCAFKFSYTCTKDDDCFKTGENKNICLSKKTYDLDSFSEIQNKEDYLNKIISNESNIFKDFANSLLKYESTPCKCVNSKCEFIKYSNLDKEINTCAFASDCEDLEISSCPANHFCFYACVKGECTKIVEPIDNRSLHQKTDKEIQEIKKEIEKKELTQKYIPTKEQYCLTDVDCIGYKGNIPEGMECPSGASFCGFVCLDNHCVYQVIADVAKKTEEKETTTTTKVEKTIKPLPYNSLCVEKNHKVDCLTDLDCERMFLTNQQRNSICK